MRAVRLAPLGDGHINHTLLAELGDGRRYVLQRINRAVFAHPERVMNNLQRVHEHLAGRAADLTPALIPTATGEAAWIDAAGEWWRLWMFIPDGRSLNRTRDTEICRAAGQAFGRFQQLLADLPGPMLEPTIPGFLELAGYLAEFDRLAARVPGAERVIHQACREDGFVDAHRTFADRLPPGQDVIHADCKLNNLLFDRQEPVVRAIVDLDTVMNGHWAWDFGDLARSILLGAQWHEEAGPGAPLTLFAVLCAGFAAGSGRSLEPDPLAEAPGYVAFMLGVRFLNDHLAGDRYFQVSRRGENLRRAREQFDLVRKLSTLDLLGAARRALEPAQPTGE